MKNLLIIFLLVITAQVFAQVKSPDPQNIGGAPMVIGGAAAGIIVGRPLNRCGCGTWGPLVLRQATVPKEYKCDSRIEWSCNRPFQFTASYQCSSSDASCKAQTTWDVKNGNVNIKNGTGTNNISGVFTLIANGTYTLTLNAKCNGIQCPPCTFTVTVKDCK